MHNKKIIVIRNIKDGSIKGINVVDSSAQYLADLRSFVKTTPNCAFALFPDEWQVEVSNIYLGVRDNNVGYTIGEPEVIPFAALFGKESN